MHFSFFDDSDPADSSLVDYLAQVINGNKNIPTNCFAVSIWHGNLYQAKYSGLSIEHILSFELISICEKYVFMEVGGKGKSPGVHRITSQYS